MQAEAGINVYLTPSFGRGGGGLTFEKELNKLKTLQDILENSY